VALPDVVCAIEIARLKHSDLQARDCIDVYVEGMEIQQYQFDPLPTMPSKIRTRSGTPGRPSDLAPTSSYSIAVSCTL
jgi:hypothetical protein